MPILFRPVRKEHEDFAGALVDVPFQFAGRDMMVNHLDKLRVADIPREELQQLLFLGCSPKAFKHVKKLSAHPC